MALSDLQRRAVHDVALVMIGAERSKLLEFWLECSDPPTKDEAKELERELTKLEDAARLSALISYTAVAAIDAAVDEMDSRNFAEDRGLGFVELDEDEDSDA